MTAVQGVTKGGTPWRKRAPVEWGHDEPSVSIPEWAPLGASNLSVSVLSRHLLALGETGSGKTKSGILPALRGMLAWRSASGMRFGAFIIDPKHELADEAERFLRERGEDREVTRLVARGGDWMVDLFEGTDPASLDEVAIVDRLRRASRTGANVQHHGNSEFFDRQGRDLLAAIVGMDVAAYRLGGLDAVRRLWRVRAEACADIAGPLDLRLNEGNYARSLHQLMAFLNENPQAVAFSISVGVPPHRPDPMALSADAQPRRTDAGCDRVVNVAMELGLPAVALTKLRVFGKLPIDTRGSVAATAENVLMPFSYSLVAHHVWTFPFSSPPPRHAFSVADHVERGAIVAFVPDDESEEAAMLGRILKQRHFAYTFARHNMAQPFAYIADEFQRFITNDIESGEQSYLDRCRAFRTVCILASQSLASLLYTLAVDTSGSDASDHASLKVLVNNTGTKFFFRTSDPDTGETLRRLIPARPNLPHVVEVRPPATLAPGECYYLMDGRWGRRRIQMM